MIKRIFKPLDKVYTGNIFERLEGLESLLSECKGASILDIGCAEGLISYEFARHGAALIHGFEIDPRRVDFAKLLFQEVPIKSEFRAANMAISFKKFERQFSDLLMDKYDTVLYLGVYHHIINQASKETVDEFISALLDKTIKFFAVRTNRINEFESIILAKGFQVDSEREATNTLGKLKIFKRVA